MQDFVSFGLLCFTSFLTLINHLGTMFIIMIMISEQDFRHRNASECNINLQMVVYLLDILPLKV